MTNEYKAEKEASVSWLQGGGIWEINFVTAVAPAAALLWAVLQTKQRFFKPYTLPAYLTDFLLHCGSILFATTAYADSPNVLIGLLILPAIAAWLQPAAEAKKEPKPPTRRLDDNGRRMDNYDPEKPDDRDPLPNKPFITTYRGAMMIITCTSILAVDFPVFPRRFAKTENFGTSLMDLGVGSFVFGAGIIAARQNLKQEREKSDAGFLDAMNLRLKTALRHSLPLFILGLVRLYTVKGLNYAEHVSEYGVHWNFFFTLALLPITTAIFQPILNIIPSLNLFAFIIAVTYETVLYMTPLKHYIILSPRYDNDWLSQNREGFFSFIGYFAIFLAGLGMGQSILPRDPDPKPTTLQQHQLNEQDKKANEKTVAAADPLDEDADWLTSVIDPAAHDPNATNKNAADRIEGASMGLIFEEMILPQSPTLLALGKWTFIWFIFCLWAMWRYGPHLFVSRRMANCAYVCWVCCFNCAQLFLFAGVEKMMWRDLWYSLDAATERRRAREATSKVLAAFNRNGLVLFLLANLLTGAINLNVQTWHLGDTEAMVVLVGYIGIVAGTGLVLDHFDVSIKL
ncbi:hypothetical protein MBLNU230_g1002t1 [Neophaeotheca triangularis]